MSNFAKAVKSDLEKQEEVYHIVESKTLCIHCESPVKLFSPRKLDLTAPAAHICFNCGLIQYLGR